MRPTGARSVSELTENLEVEDCPDAYFNPKCPYVTVINQHSADLKQVKCALVGADMQDGLVADVQVLKTYFRIIGATLVVLTPVALACLLKLFGWV